MIKHLLVGVAAIGLMTGVAFAQGAPGKNQGRTLIKGDYEVTVLDRSEHGVYNLAWRSGGTEQLIPASLR